MEAELKDIKLALLGGDGRELTLLKLLKKAGAELQVLGKPDVDIELEVISSLSEVAADLEAVIAPMTGVTEEQKIKKTFTDVKLQLTEDFFEQLPAGSKFFIGFATPELKEWCKEYEIKLIELAALDELAILNSVPTAEEAVKLAIDKSRITLHQNNSFVLGLGRVGLTLARMLKGMGSITYGVARKPSDLARAREIGFRPVHFSNLKEEIEKADFIFNTAPAPVLDRDILEQVDSEALILDLASAPGGTDFKAAEKLNLKAELALGLPGKSAPETAGRILADIIPRYLKE